MCRKSKCTITSYPQRHLNLLSTRLIVEVPNYFSLKLCFDFCSKHKTFF
nr:MAG TPA: hypothetical protein [Caudoviricetes sp.]